MEVRPARRRPAAPLGPPRFYRASSLVDTRGGVVAVVGVDDVLDDLVAHDVRAGEAHEREAVDAAEDGLQAAQPGAAPRHVDLGGVAGDDGLGPEPDAGQE